MSDHVALQEFSAIHGAMAEFNTPEQLMTAAETAYANGYRRMDAYTPMPVEGLAEAIGYKKNYVALAVLIAALSGASGGFLFLEWISGIAYVHNVGGRPINSWPAFIPITFECTILFSAITSLLCVLLMNGLPKPYHPVFNVPEFARASTDRFFLCIESTDPKFRVEDTVDFLRALGGNEVSVVPA